MGVVVHDLGVEDGGQEVVCRADGMHIAGEVEVQILHRHNLRQASASSATLDAKHRPL